MNKYIGPFVHYDVHFLFNFVCTILCTMILTFLLNLFFHISMEHLLCFSFASIFIISWISTSSNQSYIFNSESLGAPLFVCQVQHLHAWMIHTARIKRTRSNAVAHFNLLWWSLDHSHAFGFAPRILRQEACDTLHDLIRCQRFLRPLFRQVSIICHLQAKFGSHEGHIF